MILKDKLCNVKLITILIILNSIIFPQKIIKLKTASQNSAPKYFIKQNKMSGLCIDIIHAIENVNPKIKFKGYNSFLPFKRLQKYLEENKLNVFVGFKKTDKRQKKYIFINIPLYKINYVIAVRINDNIRINNILDLKNKGVILTVKSTGASKYLYKYNNLTIDDSPKSPLTMLKMLLFFRGRFAFYHDLGIKYLINLKQFKNKIKILPVQFLSYSHYIAFSDKTSIDTIKEVTHSLEILKGKKILSKIYKKYNKVYQR